MDACIHPFWELRKRTKSNGVVVVAKQCKDCGSSGGEVKKDQFDLSKLPDWDNALVERRQKKWDEENKRVQELNSQRASEWWIGYNKYLSTDHWKKIRSIVLKRDYFCQICFCRESEQAHHLTYDSFNKFGYSFATECVGLCTICHDLIHGRDAL